MSESYHNRLYERDGDCHAGKEPARNDNQYNYL
jgi:hypothetical protein